MPYSFHTLILFCLAFFCVNTSNAQDHFHDAFTGFKTGDRIPLLDEEGTGQDGDGYLFVFADAQSCFTCAYSLTAIQGNLEKSGLKVQTVLFLSGKSQRYADEEKKRNKWNFRVLADPIYAYKKLYTVKILPFYYVTDPSGKVLTMDKCGGVHVSSKDIARSLQQKKNKTNASFELKEERSFQVRDSADVPLTVSNSVYTLWSANKYVFFDIKLKYLYITDQQGVLSKRIDLNKEDSVISPMAPSWAYSDSIVFFADVGLNPAGKRIFHFLDLRTGKVNTIDPHYESLTASFHVLTKPAFDPVSENIYVGLRPKRNRRLGHDEEVMFLFNVKTKTSQVMGVPDSIFSAFNMSDAYLPLMVADKKGFVYESQSPSRRLNIYNSNAELQRSYYPVYGSNRKDFKENMPEGNGTDFSYWVGVNERTSHLMNIFPGDKIISLVYMNTVYPEGTKDPMTSEAKLPMFLHRMFVSNGQPASKNDIALPEHSKPFFVDENNIGLTENKHDRLTVKWYALPGY